jgi:hypothetical protein
MHDFIINSGIDVNSMVLLLLLPVSISFIGISRHIIGFRSLGVYLSMVITFIFYKLGQINDSIYSDPLKGLKYGILIIAFIFISAAFAYQLVRKVSLHYYPKLAIVVTIVALTIVLLVFFLGLINVKGIIQLDTFTLILIVGISEKYVSILARKKMKTALIVSFESLLQAMLCYLLISMRPFIDLIIAYPYIILILFPLNYLVGKFTGLRLTEYYRFRSILGRLE